MSRGNASFELVFAKGCEVFLGRAVNDGLSEEDHACAVRLAVTAGSFAVQLWAQRECTGLMLSFWLFRKHKCATCRLHGAWYSDAGMMIFFPPPRSKFLSGPWRRATALLVLVKMLLQLQFWWHFWSKLPLVLLQHRLRWAVLYVYLPRSIKTDLSRLPLADSLEVGATAGSFFMIYISKASRS